MGRLAATMLLLLAMGTMRPVLAAERGPVCREPSVVDEIQREVRMRDYYTHIDPRLVTETPSGDPLVVRCQVCVQAAPYDTTRFGDHPIEQCVPRGFEVRILTSGFVVRDLR
jgi:hypothetical protein